MRRRGIVASLMVAVVIAAYGATAAAQEDEPSPADAATAKQAELAAKEAEAGTAPAAAQPDVVRVGGLINDIQQLDLQSHSYNVDMYMWFKWTNPDIDPSRSFEFLNAFELWGHILSYETKEPEVLPDGSLYQVLRNQGKFNTKLPLERYPFDTQNLRVAVEDTTAASDELVYVPDEPDPVAKSDDLVIPGWNVGEPKLEVVDNQYDSNFGDPRFGDITYSRAVFELSVKRPKGTYALKLLLPLLLVALTAVLALTVHPRYVEGRITVGITALLTLVALQITSNSNLPEVDYLILLDKLYIASYAFVVLTLGVIVRNSWVDAEGDVAVARQADRRGLVFLGVAYVVVVAALFVQSLT
ncbi:MAG: hypothetical protein M3M99_07975 [Actinomycetota bacterium]|nr:hypothetical protein [Actinomycetota bacterium]